jgi:hypothetical protein
MLCLQHRAADACSSLGAPSSTVVAGHGGASSAAFEDSCDVTPRRRAPSKFATDGHTSACASAGSRSTFGSTFGATLSFAFRAASCSASDIYDHRRWMRELIVTVIRRLFEAALFPHSFLKSVRVCENQNKSKLLKNQSKISTVYHSRFSYSCTPRKLPYRTSEGPEALAHVSDKTPSS